MSAPIKPLQQSTGRARRFGALLAVVLTLLGTLAYAARLPAQRAIPASVQATLDAVTEITNQLGQDATDGSSTEDQPSTNPQSSPVQPPADPTLYNVTHVSDGDTIKVQMGATQETVRLIGVDAPELHDPRKAVQCFGSESNEYAHAALLGKSVRLEADASQQNRDKYDRLLRYVLLADGTNFNKQLVYDGYAFEYTYQVPYRYQQEFKNAEAAARQAQKGLWSPTTCNGTRNKTPA